MKNQPYLEVEGTLRWQISRDKFLYAHNSGQLDLVTMNSRHDLFLAASFAPGELHDFFKGLKEPEVFLGYITYDGK